MVDQSDRLKAFSVTFPVVYLTFLGLGIEDRSGLHLFLTLIGLHMVMLLLGRNHRRNLN
jgi:hypothetical protein